MTGKELGELRKRLNYKQEEFAERLEIRRTYLSTLEQSDDKISASIQLKIENLFSSGKKTGNDYPIPYYDIEATATPIEVFTNQTTIPHTDLDLPGFAGCDFAINVAGHSMYPTIESGSMVLCKKVNDKSLILYGEVYLIVTEDYRMVKRLKKSSKKGLIIAASDNHNGHDSPDGITYGSIEIPIDKIIFLYLVKGSIKRHQL